MCESLRGSLPNDGRTEGPTCFARGCYSFLILVFLTVYHAVPSRKPSVRSRTQVSLLCTGARTVLEYCSNLRVTNYTHDRHTATLAVIWIRTVPKFCYDIEAERVQYTC